MIIGKSLTALGGGGLKPEIRVTAAAGVLLNLHYKGSSIILQSYRLGASETTHTFVVDVSNTSYVIDDSTNSISVEVLVDSVSVFNVKIEYITWVYQNGTLNTTLTGGYDGSKYAYSSDYSCKAVWTKNSTNLSADLPGYPYCIVQSFNNKIDLSKYSKLYVECKNGGTTATKSNSINSTSSGYLLLCYLSNNIRTGWVDARFVSQKSGYFSSYTIMALSLGGDPTNGTMYVSKIWLES